MAPERTPESIWEEGDFRRISGGVTIVSELLCEAVELHALERVLDVGCGNGNTSLAAARRRAVVTGIDPTSKLLDHARERATVEGLDIDFRPGTAEHLDFPDGAFDVVLSTFAVAFAGDAEASARELVRVCRPGGRIGLTNWTDRGTLADIFRLVGDPLHAAGYAFDPLRWGRRAEVERLLGPTVRTVRAETLTRWLRADSVGSQITGYERFMGPIVTASQHLDAAGRARMRSDLTAIVQRHNTAQDGTVYGESEYLEYVGAVAVR
jgi:SAM-dependent methyltransferase